MVTTTKRDLTSFLPMFEEIKNNYGIDILKYDSLESFVHDFFASLLTTEELEDIPSELVFLNKVIEKVKIT